MGAGTTGGALSGAGTGATVGTAILPGVGTAVGAVVGGIAGAIGGMFQDKASGYMKKANKLMYQQKVKQAAIQRRDILRDFRMQRAMQIAGAMAETGNTASSTVQSAMGSFQSQFATNLGTFDWSAGHQKRVNLFTRKAGQAAETAGMINAGINAVAAIAPVAANFPQSLGYSGWGNMMDNRAIQSGYSAMYPSLQSVNIPTTVNVGP
jgi:gas vesicle protein